MALMDAFKDRAIFLDKDGTLVKNVPYNVDPGKIEFSPGATLLLSSLKSSFQFHVVTNQAGVALGRFTEKELIPVRKKLDLMFHEAGATLADFHYCPHHPEGTVSVYRKLCECRKPGSKLIEDAACRYQINLKGSWMIGDILDDIECGNKAGCRTILIDNGNETEWLKGEFRNPDFKVQDLEEAAFIILNEEH